MGHARSSLYAIIAVQMVHIAVHHPPNRQRKKDIHMDRTQRNTVTVQMTQTLKSCWHWQPGPESRNPNSKPCL